MKQSKQRTQKTGSPKNKSSKNILTGKLDISRSGMGYVIVEGQETDVMVKPHNFAKAFHGDTVKVRLTGPVIPGKRAEGEVTDVVERNQDEFIGRMQVSKNVAFFIPGSEKPLPDFYIPQDKLNGAVAVSYTHLDVYKRQGWSSSSFPRLVWHLPKVQHFLK